MRIYLAGPPSTALSSRKDTLELLNALAEARSAFEQELRGPAVTGCVKLPKQKPAKGEPKCLMRGYALDCKKSMLGAGMKECPHS